VAALTRLSFVVPVKNDAARLRRCLVSIARHHLPSGTVEVIVADNGSTDESPAVAEAAGARLRVLPNLRVSELRNRAADTARGDLLAFVDADHEVAPEWADAAVGIFLSDDKVGAAGAIYTPPRDGTWVQRMYGALRGKTSARGDTAWLGSGNLVVRRAAFEAVKGFDTSLEACEDVDLCQRLQAGGWRVMADPRLESVHLGDPATLGALFRAERWRGRDNLRVSFRGSMALRDLPSAVIPVIDLAAIAVGIWSLLTLPTSGRTAAWTLLGAAAVLVSLSGIRVLRALVSGRLSFAATARALVVAVVWDLARALALVWPGPHHRQRDDRPTPSGATAL
jgi:GT2 family glycosyltransferase